MSTGKTEMHIYGKELGTMPGTVLSKGQLNLNLHFFYVSLKSKIKTGYLNISTCIKMIAFPFPLIKTPI